MVWYGNASSKPGGKERVGYLSPVQKNNEKHENQAFWILQYRGRANKSLYQKKCNGQIAPGSEIAMVKLCCLVYFVVVVA
ncbi:hypothetical protein MLD38_019493 [Melastoma candidum]|uniref:Uncharacterized protein n=1 Tax=Melastoma candidum TaxID=119954 RepID=A0ACB9QZ21_9MYRT|nr:hypothetical protein MLD38_019493 [Melastoma candidum]